MNEVQSAPRVASRQVRLAAFALAAAVLCHVAPNESANAQQVFFTYDPAATAGPNFVSVPLLKNDPASAASVSATLTSIQSTERPLAIRVNEVPSDSAALAVLQHFPLNFVFCDFVDAERVAKTRTVGDLVLSSRASRRAFVGNFNSFPNASSDPAKPSTLSKSEAPRFKVPPGPNDYSGQRSSSGLLKGKQVAMPVLLPGSPDTRSPAAGNSTAPNLRSAFFMLGIERLTYAQLGLIGLSEVPGQPLVYAFAGKLTAAKRLIPVVSRFNNFGNPALDTDEDSTTGYNFVQEAPIPANGQLLSRGDFSALVLHYRMRGADSVIYFSSTSVDGYTGAQAANDIATGWTALPAANEIFARRTYGFASLNDKVGADGANSALTNPRNIEVAGVVWSGVYDRQGSIRRLVILVSNLSDTAKVVDFPPIGGGQLRLASDAADADDLIIGPGQHRALTLNRVGKRWALSEDSAVFVNDNRNGTGIGAADPP